MIRRTTDYTFQTPSHNIACVVGPQGARCDIGTRTWTAPPKPSTCVLDWGNGMSVTATGGSFTCAGDTLLGTGDVLALNTEVAVGGYTCTLVATGVTCLNPLGKHGFRLSKQAAVIL